MLDINTVTVIGASGNVGKKIAGIFASFGDAKVYCVSRNKEKIKRIIPEIVTSVRAESIIGNLIPADYSDLPSCIKKSDLIFESCSEDLETKSEIARIVSDNMKNNSISCTGTSGISINSIVDHYSPDKRSMFFGVHMFNPPYTLTLCELIPTRYSNLDKKNDLKNYLSTVLKRTVIETSDCAAFLANRIGFMFINKAMQLANDYKSKGGIDYIDNIFGPVTGRVMPPLVTADFVGLDVHKAIVDNLFHNTDDYFNKLFKIPKFTDQLISKNKIGNKVGQGLYQTKILDNGNKVIKVWDIVSGRYRLTRKYEFEFISKMQSFIKEGDYVNAYKALIFDKSKESDICLKGLLEYISYSVYCALELTSDVFSCDYAMASGFNWCPPLALADLINSVISISKLFNDYGINIPKGIDFKNLHLSNHYYGPFIRAKR